MEKNEGNNTCKAYTCWKRTAKCKAKKGRITVIEELKQWLTAIAAENQQTQAKSDDPLITEKAVSRN